jgi:hypothetical protein
MGFQKLNLFADSFYQCAAHTHRFANTTRFYADEEVNGIQIIVRWDKNGYCYELYMPQADPEKVVDQVVRLNANPKLAKEVLKQVSKWAESGGTPEQIIEGMNSYRDVLFQVMGEGEESENPELSVFAQLQEHPEWRAYYDSEWKDHLDRIALFKREYGRKPNRTDHLLWKALVKKYNLRDLPNPTVPRTVEGLGALEDAEERRVDGRRLD